MIDVFDFRVGFGYSYRVIYRLQSSDLLGNFEASFNHI
jgi:hypothetical protein